MKKVLILGDSISIGYREMVKKNLEGVAEVVFPEENGRFSFYTLWGIHCWIKELGEPDIVHWNNGLWDLHHEPPRPDALTPIELYKENLQRIITELRRYKPQIIWANTIPAPDDFNERSNHEIKAYNQAAMDIMKEENIPVNDLFTLVNKSKDEYICEDHVHLTEDGYRACAEQVTEIIKKYL